MLIDLRHLLRRLRRSPASAAAAVLTLTLTLGAGTSIFAIVDAVLLAPLPFADPETLVTLGETLPAEPNAAPRAVAFETLEAWRERAKSLAALEAYDDTKPDAHRARRRRAVERDRCHARLPAASGRRARAWPHVRTH